MKEEILKLRAEGKTYDEIKKILGCSKGTISYHCGEGQKEKSKERTKKNRKNLKSIILYKLDTFSRSKIRKFKTDKESQTTISSMSYKDAFNKILKRPYCYLTGREINLEESKSYQLDHIIPRSKGGSNDLKNMGLACRDANQSKYDLSVEEYLSLCKEVLEHNGYKVIKNEE